MQKQFAALRFPLYDLVNRLPGPRRIAHKILLVALLVFSQRPTAAPSIQGVLLTEARPLGAFSLLDDRAFGWTKMASAADRMLKKAFVPDSVDGWLEWEDGSRTA